MIILKNEKGKKINIGILVFRLVSIIIIIICLILLYNWNKENNENSELANEILDSFVTGSIEVSPISDTSTNNESDKTSEEYEKENDITTYESININFEKLENQNEHTVAWIKVKNTNINFPITQSKDNNFYLKHNFKKNYNSAGWIFADYRNSFDTLDENTIIYGHNRQNGTMFSNLKYLLNKNWFNSEENKSFIFNTKNNKYIAQIFSVYKINSNQLTLSNSFKDETDFAETVSGWKENSIYTFNSIPNYKDNIITLCTCDNNTQYRIVVHAKLINVE